METTARRRGEALEAAIFAAVMAEIGEVGVAGLTMERVAARAKTGKAALYRRWASIDDLALDTFSRAWPAPPPQPSTGNLRDDLLALVTDVADSMANANRLSPHLVVAEIIAHPRLGAAWRAAVVNPRHDIALRVLRAAADRGEISYEQVTPVVARVGAALVVQQHLALGKPPTRKDIREIVDRAWLPAASFRY
jgi:AcrR family transcriptional regulator